MRAVSPRQLTGSFLALICHLLLPKPLDAFTCAKTTWVPFRQVSVPGPEVAFSQSHAPRVKMLFVTSEGDVARFSPRSTRVRRI